MADVPVETTTAENIAIPLKLLEEYLRDGDPLPETFVRQLREAIEAGTIEVLVAGETENPSGVAVISYRPNISLGGTFASIEDLYVRPDVRRWGVGHALIKTAEQRCASRSISYLEAQVESDEAAAFYSAVGYEVESGVEVLSRSLTLRSVGENS